MFYMMMANGRRLGRHVRRFLATHQENATMGARSRPISEREERLQAALRELERRFGRWILYRLKDARSRVSGSMSGVISSGSLSLDLATGIGGYPRGRMTELIGPRSSGKSILASHLLANAQHHQSFVALIDSSHQANFEQMARCGVDLPDLFLIVPESIREAIDVAALLIDSGGLDVLAIGPLAELIGDSRQEGREAAEGLARLNTALHLSPTVVLFLTDRGLRPAAVPLSRALRHFATLRILLTPLRPLVHPSGDILGLRIRVEISKNKLAPPQRQAELDLRRDRGLHREADLVDLGLTTGVLSPYAIGICFGRTVLGRGRARAIAALESDPELARALQDEIRRGWPG
jgi:recombination protein RecA